MSPSSCAPAFGFWTAAVLSAGAGWVWAAVLLTVAAAAVTPIAHRLSHRLMLWTIAGLAIGTIWSFLPGPLATVSSAFAFAALLAPAVAIPLIRRSSAGWIPRLDAADATVVVGALLLLATLLFPYLNLVPDAVLLDLARGYDNYPHFTMLRNLVIDGSAAWQSDSASVPLGESYPLAVHFLMALSLDPLGAGEPYVPAALLRDFGVLAAMAVSMSSALLGWMALEVAAIVPNSHAATNKRMVASFAFLISAPLGGLFSGVFQVGHVPFALPTTTVVCASWLSIKHGARWPEGAAAVLLVASLGALGSYPPLIIGLLPTAVALALGRSRRLRRSVLLGAIFAVPVAVAALWGLRGTLPVIVDATGELSTNPLVSLMGVATMGALLVVARGRGAPWLVVQGSGPVIGFGMVAAAFALLSIPAGIPVLSNYYVGKMLQGQWLAALPLVIGLASGLLVDSVSRRRHWRSARIRLVAVTGIALGVLLAYLPDGRYRLGSQTPNPPGIQVLQRRLLETSRADDASRVVEVAVALGTTQRETAVLIEPPAWDGYVSFDVPEWTKSASVASAWLATLRGVQTGRGLEIAACADQPPPKAVSCIRALQQMNPQDPITLIVPPQAFARWSTLLDSDDEGIRLTVHPWPRNGRHLDM